MKMLPTAALLLAVHIGFLPAEAQLPPDVVTSVNESATLPIEDLGSMIRSNRVSRLRMVPNPDGKSWDLIQIYFKQYGGPNTFVIMDLGSGEVKQVHTEFAPHRYNFHLAPAVLAPNGKLYFNILAVRNRQMICIYDPAANDMQFNAIPLPETLGGETHPMVLGTDKMLYAAGGHPSKAVTAVRINPDTHEVEDFGPIGPTHAPAAAWAYSVAADNRYVYIASGKVPWYLVAYDRQTGKTEVLAQTDRVDGFMGVRQGPYGCTAFATHVVGTDGQRIEWWLHEGKAIIKQSATEAAPWAEPDEQPSPKVMAPRPEVTQAAAQPDHQGRAAIWHRTPTGKKDPSEVEPAEPADEPQDSADDAALLAAGWKPIRYTVPIYPQRITRVIELHDGRIFGAAGNYEGNFLFDPATGKGEHLGVLHLSEYSETAHDGKVYMSGYPSSPVFVYDPSKPWTANERAGAKLIAEGSPESNPRRMTYMKASGAHKMYDAAVANGKVYFGGRWYRTGDHGGLGWWDIQRQEAGGMWEPFSNYQINFIADADAGRTLVVSAHRVDDNVLGKPKPEQGSLFFIETNSNTIVGKLEPVMKAKGPGPIVASGNTLVGWTEEPENPKQSILYSVDMTSRQVTSRRTLPWPLPIRIGSNQTEPFDFRLGPDGFIWTFADGKTLIRIDPKSLDIHAVGKVGSGGRIAFSGKDVYLGGTEQLRRVKAVVP